MIFAGIPMSIVAEILSLRRSQTSSVEILLGALDWQKSAQDKQHILARGYAVFEAADMVLLNVAAHAAGTLNEPPRVRRTRHAVPSSRRNRRRTDSGQSHQRMLFA
jgi:hypothetical protein